MRGWVDFSWYRAGIGGRHAPIESKISLTITRGRRPRRQVHQHCKLTRSPRSRPRPQICSSETVDSDAWRRQEVVPDVFRSLVPYPTYLKTDPVYGARSGVCGKVRCIGGPLSSLSPFGSYVALTGPGGDVIDGCYGKQRADGRSGSTGITSGFTLN